MSFVCISFFKLYVKEAVVVTIFCLSLTYSRSRPRNDMLFSILFVLQSGISDVIYDEVLTLFREGMKISFRLYGAIPFQYLR